MKIINLFLLIILLSACSITKVVDVKENQKTTSEGLAQVNDGLGKINNDLLTLQAVQQKWSDAQSRQKLQKLIKSQQNITQYYTRLKENFESSPYKNRQKISAEDKDYAAAMKEEAEFKTHLANLENQLKNYRSDRNSLKDYLETKQIFRVDPKVMNKDFVDALNLAKKTQLNVKNDLMDYNVKLNQSTEAEEKKIKQKTTIQELVKIVEQMENETFRLQRVHVATMNEFGPGVKFVTPGTRAHGYNNKIQSILSIIRGHEEKFKAMALTLEN